MSDKDTVFLVAFFKFHEDPRFGFERIHLQGVFKTEKEAREEFSFCDEAGWYEGVLIEELQWGCDFTKYPYNRIWFVQQEDGSLKEIPELEYFKNVVNLIG
jgi:hypothetical protein